MMHSCRIEGCDREFLTEQGRNAHEGRMHTNHSFDADLILLSRLGNEYSTLMSEVKSGEERAETYKSLADSITDSVRSRRIEATIIKGKMNAIKVKLAEAGIPLEVLS